MRVRVRVRVRLLVRVLVRVRVRVRALRGAPRVLAGGFGAGRSYLPLIVWLG